MHAFWQFARRMLRYRWTVAWALVFAFISALGLGAGLVSIAPVLNEVLSEGGSGLPDLARAWNQQVGNAASWARLPEHVVATLPEGRFTAVATMVAGLGVLTAIGGCANFLHAYLSLSVVYRTVAGVRREAFHRAMRLPLKSVVAGGPSDLVSRIINDGAMLSSGFETLLSRGVGQACKGVAALGAAMILEPIMVLGALPVTALLYGVIRKLGKRVRRASRGALAEQSRLLGAATEVLQGLRVVKAFTGERYEAGRFHRINKSAMREMLRARTARALASPLVEVISIFALGILALIAARAIIDNRLDPTNLGVALAALFAAGASLKPLTGLVSEIQASSAAAGRLAELLTAPPEPGHDARLPKLPRHGQSLEFEDVWFTYPGAADAALRGISLRVEHGECVAIVGPNGCGKSTLLAMIARLLDPDEHQGRHGRVLVDGRDVRDYTVRSLRRQVGLVAQDVVLFRGTVRDNIAYGSGGGTAARVVDAARAARAHEFIERLPGGYDAPVGEQGATLSGGQRQRLAIARALVREPAILILDEATSMIDAESEARIGEAIAEFRRGRTCVLVAHRLSTVLGADRIVVMDEGRIADQGRHDELLARCDVYRQLAQHQLLGAPLPGAQ